MTHPELADKILEWLMIEQDGTSLDIFKSIGGDKYNDSVIDNVLDQMIEEKPKWITCISAAINQYPTYYFEVTYIEQAKAFLEHGGFLEHNKKQERKEKQELADKELDRKLKKVSLRNAQITRWISIIALIISLIALLISLHKEKII
jgi:hypothetical protein